jgi:hypothetical protein
MEFAVGKPSPFMVANRCDPIQFDDESDDDEQKVAQ